MIAVKTDLNASQLPDTLDPMLPVMEQRIPAGVGQGHERGNAPYRLQDYVDLERFRTHPFAKDWVSKAIEQFGSLGSGNHFVEVCLDEIDNVWCVLHSGSRGIGNQLASRHIKVAKGLMKKWQEALEDSDLAYLIEGSAEFDAYISDMMWAQDYAYHSRERMMDAGLDILFKHVGFGREVQRINCHHNYTARESHGGQDVWLTRKGAIKAGDGDLGIIPGSMGTRSYIVRGKGNPDSFESCSHGAGRRLSRSAAKKQFTGADLAEQMGDRSWQKDKADQLVDEIPSAYKDIDVVMENQKDLVSIEYTLRQILNYKGTK